MKFKSQPFIRLLVGQYLVAILLIILGNVAFADLPRLNDEFGNSRIVDHNGQFGQSRSQFTGGISLDRQVFSQNLKIAVNQELDLDAQVTPDADIVGQAVDLLLVIGLETSAPFDGGIDTEYFALDAHGNKKFVNLYAAAVWMAQLTEPFKAQVILDRSLSFELGQLQFSAKAVFYIFVGYRTEQGIITYNPRPMIVDTTASIIEQPLPANHEDSIVYTPLLVVPPEPPIVVVEPPAPDSVSPQIRFTPVTHATENTDIVSNSVVLKNLSEASSVIVTGGQAF